ncbi:MAG: carboxypeptidase regulatory-like domain-containing protein [Planctomycetota bacterium]
MSVSSAQVKVYRGSGLVATFNVPNQAGTLWTVFTLSGSTLTPINTMSFESDPSAIGSTNQSTAGTANGVIRTITGTGMAGATVTFYNQSSTLVGTYTTDVNGVYTATLAAGVYTINVSLSGYITNTVSSVTITANVATVVEPIRQVPITTTTGTVSGIINDAFNGYGVVGALLSFRSGININTGTVVLTATTTTGGAYTASGLAAGNYTVQATLTNYTTLFFTVTCVGGQTTANQNTTITPVIPVGQTRVVLTWGATPSDLDSHMTVPTPTYTAGTDRFHVYYANGGSSTSSPYVDLDVDDTSSYGPETITIYQQFSGTYRYSIHDYSNGGSTTSNAMAASSAQVKVYRGSSLIATYNVPNQAGTLWTVFELNNNTITPINTMTFESDSSNVRRVIIPVSYNDSPLMRKLPLKK